jgi:hypothetical protein
MKRRTLFLVGALLVAVCTNTPTHVFNNNNDNNPPVTASNGG